MGHQFDRIAILFGDDYLNKLKNKKVAIFGVGGVGGYVCEGLARSGISNFVLVDADDVDETNLNRQIISTVDNIGLDKVDVMTQRILSINPEANVEIHKCFYLPENSNDFDFSGYDYVVDAVDTVSAKISIITKAKEASKPVISAMGAGNKLDPTKLIVCDISKTDTDPLSRTMRYELRKRGVKGVKVVYSKELPIEVEKKITSEESGKVIPGSMMFVPATMGIIMAKEIINDLIKEKGVDL